MMICRFFSPVWRCAAAGLAFEVILPFLGGYSLAAQVSEAPLSLADALPERAMPELNAVLQRGASEGPSVLARRWEYAQAEANARYARSPMLPTLSGYVNMGRILEQRQNSDQEDRELEAVLYGASIYQPVYHWGALANGYAIAKLQRAIAERNLREARRLIVLDLRRRFLDVIIATNTLADTEATIASLRRESEVLRQQLADGFISSAVATAPESRITSLEVQLQYQRNTMEAARRALRAITGLPDEIELVVPAGVPAFKDLASAVEGASPAALHDSVRRENARDGLRSERLNYKVTNTRLRPKFGFSFSLSQDNRNPDNDVLGPKQLLTTWSAYLTAGWTVFDGFATPALRAASRGRIRSLELELARLEREDRDLLHADIGRLKYAWKALQQAEKSLAGAESTVTLAENNLKDGWGSQQAVDDAKMSLNSTRASINSSRAEFYMAVATYLSDRGEDPALRELGR